MSVPRNVEGFLAVISMLAPGEDAVKDLGRIAAEDPDEAPRLVAIQTAGRHFVGLASRRSLGRTKRQHHDKLLQAYLDLLLSWLPLGPELDEEFRAVAEALVLAALGSAQMARIHRVSDLTPVRLEPLEQLLDYSRRLSSEGTSAYEAAVALWMNFFGPGILGVNPWILLDSTEPADQVWSVVDGVCAWLVKDPANDEKVLPLLGHYIGPKTPQTREVVEGRLWGWPDGVLRMTPLLPSEEAARVYLDDPFRVALAKRKGRSHHNPELLLVYLTMLARSGEEDWLAPLGVPPQWVTVSDTWAQLREKANS